MEFKQLKIKDVVLVKPDVYKDNRGYFFETYNDRKIFKETNGVDSKYWNSVNFIQDNLSHNYKKNVVRGLHYQESKPQSKFVSCIQGAILDVVVDLRKDSDTFGEWLSVVLNQDNNHQLWIPKGFAHGYRTLTSNCTVIYKVDEFYDHSDYRGIIWNDSGLNIDWGIDNEVKVIVSEQDKSWKRFDEIFKSTTK